MAAIFDEPRVVTHEGRARELERVVAKMEIDDYRWSVHVGSKLEGKPSVMVDHLAARLGRELLDKGFIRIEAFKDHVNFRMTVKASILVSKDQA